MLYKKYHRNYVRQFKKGVKFRFNGFNGSRINRAKEPILSVVFDPFVGICVGNRGHRFWGYNVSIDVDICIIYPDGKLSNDISIVSSDNGVLDGNIVNDDNIVPETEKICSIKNIIKTLLASLRKVLSLCIEVLDQRLLR